MDVHQLELFGQRALRSIMQNSWRGYLTAMIQEWPRGGPPARLQMVDLCVSKLLQYAIMMQRMDAVDAIFRETAIRPSFYEVNLAVRSNNPALARLVLQNHRGPLLETILETAITASTPDIVHVLLTDGNVEVVNPNNIVAHAHGQGRPEIVAMLEADPHFVVAPEDDDDFVDAQDDEEDVVAGPKYAEEVRLKCFDEDHGGNGFNTWIEDENCPSCYITGECLPTTMDGIVQGPTGHCYDRQAFTDYVKFKHSKHAAITDVVTRAPLGQDWLKQRGLPYV